MLTLGEVVTRMRRSAGEIERVSLADDLRERLVEAAIGAGMTPASYARAAVADFTDHASPDEWSTLISRLRDADDPGGACLALMIERRLRGAGKLEKGRAA